MKKTNKILLIAFIILVSLKIIAGLIIKIPLGFADNYIYMKIANSFITEGIFLFDGIKYNLYPPLYSIFISVAYLFKDSEISFFVIKIINAILSSTIIFIAYYISRKICDEKLSLKIAILTSIIPSFFCIAFYPLSENLYYPLFALFFLALYNSIETQKIKWIFLSGILLGLLYLTKFSTVFIIPIIIIIIIYYLFKKRYKLAINNILVLIFAFLVALPWLIRNIILYGFSLNGMIGRYIATVNAIEVGFSLLALLKWTLYTATFIIIATGLILVPAIIFYLIKKRTQVPSMIKLAIIFIGTYLIFCAVYFSLRNNPLGRYLNPIYPLVILTGIYSIYKLKEEFKEIKLWKITIPFMIIFGFSYQLSQSNLFPVNNIELSSIGLINYGITYLGLKWIFIFIPLFLVLPLVILTIKKIKINTLFLGIIIFFIITNLISYSMIAWDAEKRWETLETTQLGKWMNQNIDQDKILYIDMEDHMYHENFVRKETNYKRETALLVTTMFVNNKINAIDIDEIPPIKGYLLSSQKLDLPIIKSTTNPEIYLYEIN